MECADSGIEQLVATAAVVAATAQAEDVADSARRPPITQYGMLSIASHLSAERRPTTRLASKTSRLAVATTCLWAYLMSRCYTLLVLDDCCQCVRQIRPSKLNQRQTRREKSSSGQRLPLTCRFQIDRRRRFNRK